MKQPDPQSKDLLGAQDSPALILRSLNQDRGTVFTETEYTSMRNAVIEELAHGPVCRWTTVLTVGIVGGLLLLLTLAGVFIVAHGIVSDYTLVIVGAGSVAAWCYVVSGYRKAFRNHARRSLQERLAELEDLRAQQLITQAEFERIYAAIHISRAEPQSPLSPRRNGSL